MIYHNYVQQVFIFMFQHNCSVQFHEALPKIDCLHLSGKNKWQLLQKEIFKCFNHVDSYNKLLVITPSTNA